MVSAEQQREIAAVALLALALFLLLALFPVEWFGARGVEWFPSGNVVGIVGGTVDGFLTAFLGASALVAPPLLLVLGLHVGGWLAEGSAARYGVLGSGLMLLLPTGVWVLTEREVTAGWLGATLGPPLMSLVGWVGAVLLVGVALVVLCVATIGWNPLRTLVRGMMAGSAVAGEAARGLAERTREARVRRPQVADAPLPGPIPGMAPVWAEEDAGDEPWAEGDTEEPFHGISGAPEEAEETDGPDSPPQGRAPAIAAGTRASAVAGEMDGADEDGGDGWLEEEPGSEVREVPPVDLLSAPERSDRSDMERALDDLGRVLVAKLRTFNVESEIGGRTTGPVVTQFEVVPAPGVKVNKIANLEADLALAMKAQSIRIVAPIPGKGAVGVEIPNPEPEIVNLREILESPAFRGAKGDLPLALGKDLAGRPFVTAMEKMPHLLIAGATGAGKSVCINTLVTSLVYRHTPETLRLLLIDPKMVELSVYSRLPHLRHNVVTDPRDAAGVLKWAVIEMERRYTLLKTNHVRSIAEFNRKVREGALLRRIEAKGPEGDENRWIYSDGLMPYIVVVVDELADLMMTVQGEIEKPLTQLAQKARAIGIHLIVATQRPSVNVITGLIKANFPTRIAFRVASKTDSRTILDQNGADALLGNGDMLFLPPGRSDPVRIQGAFLPTEDTERLMGWYIDLLERRSGERTRSERDILDEVRSHEIDTSDTGPEEIAGDWDDLFRAAAEACIQNQGGSTSLLQRRLSIGYGRAARIVDQLFEAGVLGPSEGAKGREVLITMEDLDAMFGGAGR